MKDSHPVVAEYLARFDEAARVIPSSRRKALRQEVLDHLSSAIPVGLSDTDAELILAGFGNPDEIVAQEMEGSTAAGEAPRKPWPLTTLGVGSIAVVAVTLAIAISFLLSVIPPAGSAESGSGGPFNVVTAHPDGVERVFEGRAYEEYRAAITTLGSLPVGAAWPEGVPEGIDVGSAEGSGIMQSGMGANVAQFTYLCAWEAEYISAEHADDAKRLATALSTLEDFADSSFMSDLSPDGGWWLNVISPLTFADSSGLRHDFPGACQGAGIHNVDRSMRDHAFSG